MTKPPWLIPMRVWCSPWSGAFDDKKAVGTQTTDGDRVAVMPRLTQHSSKRSKSRVSSFNGDRDRTFKLPKKSALVVLRVD